jgi:hypothetical protein
MISGQMLVILVIVSAPPQKKLKTLKLPRLRDESRNTIHKENLTAGRLV